MSNQINQANYQSPRRSSEPIISTAIINFHNISDNEKSDCILDQVQIDLEKDHIFGIMKLNVRDEIPIVVKLYIEFTIDCSGSMSDVCSDGRTKMKHIIYTLENMLRIFHKTKETNISVRIKSFDTYIYVDVDTIENIGQKTQDELESIIAKVHKIIPKGSTNIENALKATSEHLASYIKDHPSTQVAHILLTDGEITDGNTDNTYLKTLVSNDYPNIFMGYGTSHDAMLLTNLASTGLHNEYRFVDALEKAGLVYGEVIHQLFYKAVEDVNLQAENCEIYDYDTNMWTTMLQIGSLVSEQVKTYQIRSYLPSEARIAILGRTIHKTKMNETLSDANEVQCYASPVQITKCDLSDYIFRQKTQELLFAAKDLLTREQLLEHRDNNSFNQNVLTRYNSFRQPNYRYDNVNIIKEQLAKEKVRLQKQMKDFFKIMLDYIEQKDLQSSVFMKTLCDDIYVSIKSFDTSNGMMYATARQTSQGRQQTYTCNTIDIIDTTNTMNTVEYNDLDDRYTLSQENNFALAHSSQGVVQMMRAVSNNTDPLEQCQDLYIP
jgi:hypothetical protein